MAINPADITTVQVKELPPNPFSGTDNIPHEVGDVLSKGTLDQLVAYIRTQAPEARPYECKIIFAPNFDYINDNFDMSAGASQGLGKTEGLWAGWAICNGNNGTENVDGQTLIGYGAVNNSILQSLGNKEHTLTINEMPAHNHTGLLKGSVNTSGGSGQNVVNNNTNNTGDINFTTANRGGGQPFSLMQPSLVVLIIMKLP